MSSLFHCLVVLQSTVPVSHLENDCHGRSVTLQLQIFPIKVMAVMRIMMLMKLDAASAADDDSAGD